MLSAGVPIVDKLGRPTPFFMKQIALLSGDAPGSLTTRVTDLESDVAGLETLTAIQGASIATLVADVAAVEADILTLQGDVTTLDQRVDDNEIRIAFGAACLW